MPLAQGLDSDACETAFGICRVAPRPLGSYCDCYGDPGIIVPRPPPPQREVFPWDAPLEEPPSIVCETLYGVCRVPVGPVGSYCNCFGDPGLRVR